MDERGERTPEHPGDLFVEHDEKQNRTEQLKAVKKVRGESCKTKDGFGK
jgi:hypothetical protein